MISFTIKGEMTNLNTYIQKERTNKFLASKIKRQETESACWFAKKVKQKIVDYPIVVEAIWYTKNLKVDMDNIVFSKKFILDGMVMAGLIKDDSRKYVKIWRDLDIFVDEHDPRVEINIYPYVQV